MAINRRDLLKITGISAAALAVGGCAADNAASTEAPKGFSLAHSELMPAPKGKRVVVCGGGFGGLTVAKYLRKASKEVEVVVLEKRDNFMSCPYSNCWMGGVMDPSGKKPVTLDTLSFDYYTPASKHGYHFIQATITGFDKAAKVVKTDKGYIGYDYLVITGGIEYDYSKLFGADKEKAAKCLMECPPALKPGSEHLALKKQLDELEEGNFIITVPDGAYRCPPAPYERAAMVANFIKENKINAKVLILDPRPAPGAKPKQFMEVYKTLYSGIIEYHKNTHIKDVDFAKKVIHVEVVDGDKKEAKTVSYAVANIIPKNIASPLMKMADVKTNADGYALVKLPMHTALKADGSADENVFVLGDAIAATNFAAGSGYPKSGHMANSQGKIVAKQIAAKLGVAKDDGLILPDNTCFSMVRGNPKEAVVVNHKVEYLVEADGTKKIKVSASAKGENAADRPNLGKATDEWYKGIMNDLFG